MGFCTSSLQGLRRNSYLVESKDERFLPKLVDDREADGCPCTLEHRARVSCQLLLFEDASLSQWPVVRTRGVATPEGTGHSTLQNDHKMSCLSEGVNAEYDSSSGYVAALVLDL